MFWRAEKVFCLGVKDQALDTTLVIGNEEKRYTIFGLSVSDYRHAMKAGRKFAYIDEEGVMLIAFVFDRDSDFSENRWRLVFALDKFANRDAYYSVDT